MRYQVPQFLGRQTKIVLGLSFKQLAVLMVAGVLFFILYYSIPKGLFFLLLFFGGGGLLALFFVRIEETPLYEVIARSFGFFVKPRTYVWKKEESVAPLRLVSPKSKEEKKGEEKEESPLKVSPESRLNKLSSKIEIGIK